jgi:hypothetical protein
MAKANLKTKGGTTVVIEGTPEEVALLVERIEGERPVVTSRAPRTRSRGGANAAAKATPVNLISSLIDGGFFRKPKDLASVKVALEEMGHFYPVTSLSPALLRLVRRRQLRRLRDKKRWMYTG